VGSIPVAGPAAALVVARALGGRSREAWLLAIGAALPEGVYAALACWGIGAIFTRFPTALGVSRLATALVLAAVGVWLVLRAPAVVRARLPARGAGRGIVVGLATTIANPTLALTWSAAVSALHSVGLLDVGARAAPWFGLGVATGVTGWFALAIRLIGGVHARMRDGLFVHLVRAVGAVLLGTGVVAAARAIAAH
jgi:threonine/homoserine/homoserine lactone efflux protein